MWSRWRVPAGGVFAFLAGHSVQTLPGCRQRGGRGSPIAGKAACGLAVPGFHPTVLTSGGAGWRRGRGSSMRSGGGGPGGAGGKTRGRWHGSMTRWPLRTRYPAGRGVRQVPVVPGAAVIAAREDWMPWSAMRTGCWGTCRAGTRPAAAEAVVEPAEGSDGRWTVADRRKGAGDLHRGSRGPARAQDPRPPSGRLQGAREGRAGHRADHRVRADPRFRAGALRRRGRYRTAGRRARPGRGAGRCGLRHR